jgi:hypothetical protein
MTPQRRRTRPKFLSLQRRRFQIRPDGPILDVPPEAGDFGRLDSQWAMRPTPIVQKFLMGKLGPPVQTEQYFDHDENRRKIEFLNDIDCRSFDSLTTV